MMREISFEESKSIMIKTLASIDCFCRKNNINYSLCWGTMIGAIRHHGFIPWDDDIDVMMPRDDYNRFIRTYNDPDYRIYTLKPGSKWHMLHSRISNKKTAVFFDGYKKSPHGCWISIFPFDHVPDDHRDEWEENRTKAIRLFQLKTAKWRNELSFVRNCMRVLGKQVLLFVSTYSVGLKVNKILSQYNGQKTKEISLWDNGLGFTSFYYFPAELFDDYMDVDFDGVNCRIIKAYDQFLKMYYGNYMQFPPVEQQVPSHNYKAYWIE